MTDYTVEDLLAMSPAKFHTQVIDDLRWTSNFDGPFQDPDVVMRTMAALMEWLWITNEKIEERAEDPNCSSELFQSTVRFRRHLLAVIDNTERRTGWLMGTKERAVRKWKQVLFEVVDAIKQGWDDDEILSLCIPPFRDAVEMYDLDTWHEIRLEKQPDRKRAEKEVA